MISLPPGFLQVEAVIKVKAQGIAGRRDVGKAAKRLPLMLTCRLASMPDVLGACLTSLPSHAQCCRAEVHKPFSGWSTSWQADHLLEPKLTSRSVAEAQAGKQISG